MLNAHVGMQSGDPVQVVVRLFRFCLEKPRRSHVQLTVSWKEPNLRGQWYGSLVPCSYAMQPLTSNSCLGLSTSITLDIVLKHDSRTKNPGPID